MEFPHAGLECRNVESAVRTTFHTHGDSCLQRRDCILPLMVFADQMTNIVASITETPIMGPALNPVFHRIGQGYIHRCHCFVFLHVSQDGTSWQTSPSQLP